MRDTHPSGRHPTCPPNRRTDSSPGTGWTSWPVLQRRHNKVCSTTTTTTTDSSWLPQGRVDEGLSILLQPLTGHTVDDGVPARVDVPHPVGDDQDGDGEDNHQPKNDVERDRKVPVVIPGQVPVRLPANKHRTLCLTPSESPSGNPRPSSCLTANRQTLCLTPTIQSEGGQSLSNEISNKRKVRHTYDRHWGWPGCAGVDDINKQNCRLPELTNYSHCCL